MSGSNHGITLNDDVVDDGLLVYGVGICLVRLPFLLDILVPHALGSSGVLCWLHLRQLLTHTLILDQVLEPVKDDLHKQHKSYLDLLVLINQGLESRRARPLTALTQTSPTGLA